MSVKYVLLGLLLERPGYPYQLADRMQKRLGPSWQLDSGQFYRAVKGLERDELIERIRNESIRSRRRHVFAITERGVEEFDRWFEQTPDAMRSSARQLLVKITFAGPGRLPQAMTKVEDYRCNCAKLLDEITAMRDALPGTEQEPPRAEDALHRLSLSTDIFQREGEIRWARHAHETLSRLSEQQAHWPSQQRGLSKDADPERRVGELASPGEVARTGS
jgi:DNA-binding PadR family transcriptional regulator